MPAIICLTWLTFVGATAIDLELQGVAKGSIVNADISSQLFATINLMLSPSLAVALSAVVVVLLLTFLVTSADSGILIINTLASGAVRAKKVLVTSSFGGLFSPFDRLIIGRWGHGCTALGYDCRRPAIFRCHGLDDCGHAAGADYRQSAPTLRIELVWQIAKSDPLGRCI